MHIKDLAPETVKRWLRPAYRSAYSWLLWRFRNDYSQSGETIEVRRILNDRAPMTFLEVGANDGLTFSTTLGLLKKGWSGYSVEPNPVIYKVLVKNLSTFEKAKAFNLAIAPSEGRVKLFFGRDDPAGLYATLSTENNDWYSAHRAEEYVEVEGLPLSVFIQRNNLPNNLSLLIIDTEGMDLEVLKTLDPGKHRPRLIITEDYAPKNDEKFALLKSYNYSFISRIGCNTFWIDGAFRP